MATAKIAAMLSGAYLQKDLHERVRRGIGLLRREKFFWGLLLLYYVLFWKISFYILLLSVNLPEDAIILKRQVSYTDVYYPHILAEIAFVSDLGYDNIRETILEENRIIMGEILDLTDSHIMDREMLREWDDYCISVKEIDELAAQTGNQSWYYVSLNMPVPALVLIRILNIILIFAVIRLVSGIKRKAD